MKLPPFSYIQPEQLVTLPNGATITFSDSGEIHKKAVIFIHGLQSSSGVWISNIGKLQNFFRCITLDLPGHGNSAAGNYSYSTFFFSQVVEELINHLQLQQVVLVGHSMGAQVAIITAIRLQGRIEKLVLAAPAGFETFTKQEGEALLDWMAQQDTNFGYFPMLGQQQVAQQVLLKSTEGMLNEPIFELLMDVKQPVLVLFGENDPLIPNRFLHPRLTTEMVAENGLAELENAELVMLPNCGHFIPLEKPETVNKLLLEFINKP